MKILLSIFLLFFIEKALCQLNQIPIESVTKTEVGELFCLDSTGKITRMCSVDLNAFSVQIYQAFRDMETKELRLIGKVYMGKTSEGKTFGISGVGIIRSKKNNNQTIRLNYIGETSEDTTDILNGGFFDIKTKIASKESLFFYNPSFFLREFRISQLFKY